MKFNDIPDSNRIDRIVDSLSTIISIEMPRHINRWGSEGSISSIEEWTNELNEIKQFSQERANIVQEQYINELMMIIHSIFL